MAGLEARVTWRCHGVARRATCDAACFSYARTRNRTMARDTFPFEVAHFCTRFATERGRLGTRSSINLWKCGKICGERLFVRGVEVSRDPDFRVELDETRALHPPARPNRTFKTTLSFVRAHHDAHHTAHVKAPHRSKSLKCSSETENDLRDDTVPLRARLLLCLTLKAQI